MGPTIGINEQTSKTVWSINDSIDGQRYKFKTKIGSSRLPTKLYF